MSAEPQTDAAPLAAEYDGSRRMRAGTLARFAFRCTAKATLAAGARIAIAHRWPSDWGIAQSSDPAAADYLDVRAASTGLRWWNARLHAWHPFDHIVFVELLDPLRAGETITLAYGAPEGGSPGFRVQTFIEEASPFSLRFQAAPELPWIEFARETIEVVGDEASRLVVTAPSRVDAGRRFTVHVRAEDRWGNPASGVTDVELSGPLHVRAKLSHAGWVRLDARIDASGTYRIEARAIGVDLPPAVSNPVEVHAQAPSRFVWWGDLHAQSVIGCGARSIDAYYAHARDFAAADFGSHQANCFLVSNAEWRETQAATARHNAPERFVTLLGVEWSGATTVGGDHNLYFPGDAAPLRRCSHEFVEDKADVASDLAHVDDLYAHYRGTDTLIAVHVGGRTADLKYHEPTLDRLLEVHSTHATSEWFLFEALRRGYRFGVIAGSDSVDGRPGNSHPGHMGVRNLRGGLTAVLAPRLTRTTLWDALARRHCYATTGERIVLDFRAGDASMGDSVQTATPLAFDVRVEGTAPLETIDFFRGTQLVESVDLLARAGPLSSQVRIAWRGMSAPGNWQRARMTWDGEVRVQGARILGVTGYAFDTADEGVCDSDRGRVAWRSITAGDWDGVVVDLDRPDDAELVFTSAAMNVRARLDSVDAAGRRFDAASPERCIEIRRLPAAMPAASFSARFTDASAARGEHAYWVRVRQTDGAYAWSTPIFVTLRGD